MSRAGVDGAAFVVAKRWRIGVAVLVAIAWAHRGRASGMVVELKLRELQVPGNRVLPPLLLLAFPIVSPP
jgi:hypothetical protein